MLERFADIAIVSRVEATRRFRVGPRYDHVISISNPDDPAPPGFAGLESRKLELHFHDIVDHGPMEWAPTQSHVRELLAFAEGIGPDESLLCHCNAGISRSSASALAVLASKLPPSPAAAAHAVSTLRRIKRAIVPNSRMVAFADAELGYGGVLRSTLAEYFDPSGRVLW